MLEQTVIKELKVGDKIEGFYLLKDPQIKMTTGGKPFLRGGISDRTGCVEMKVWDYSGMITAADNQGDALRDSHAPDLTLVRQQKGPLHGSR